MNAVGLRSFSAPSSLAGMRPVDIWKSTAAAPAPIRLGACVVPWASSPWHVEQLCRNSAWPCATWVESWAGAAADAPPPENVL